MKWGKIVKLRNGEKGYFYDHIKVVNQTRRLIHIIDQVTNKPIIDRFGRHTLVVAKEEEVKILTSCTINF